MLKRTRLAICLLSVFLAATATAQNLRMGARYHIIDKDVERVTTAYADVEITTSRLEGGALETRLSTRDGRAIGSPWLTRPEQIRLIGQSKTSSAEPIVVSVDAQPLDAVNAERFLAWKNKTAPRSSFKETAAAFANTEGPVEMAAAAGDIHWVKSSTRQFEAFSRIGMKGLVDGREQPAFTSVVREDGEVLGVMSWFPLSQILMFQTRWRQEPTYITAKNLPNGTWPFTPNMAWANIQLLSFAKSADAHGHKNGGNGAFDVVAHNDPGCDGLHWLDGTVLRQCCDIHDACYFKQDPDCTYLSWFFQGSWSCVQCNIEAIQCFVATIMNCEVDPICPVFPVYDWGPDWPPFCYLGCYCYCPAWCYGCDPFYGW